MGCDIHMFAEVFNTKTNKWGLASNDLYCERNYYLFAILADVRNGVGFAGTITGEKKDFISPPKGIPNDVSPEVQESISKWMVDGHSFSWLSLKELLDFPWSEKTTINYGVLSEEEYNKWDKKSRPQSYCGAVLGIGIKILSEQEYLSLKTKDKGISYYIRVQWEETYAQCVSSFYTEVIPKLKEMAPEGNPEYVRIVFFFDN